MARTDRKDMRRHVRYELIDFALLEHPSLEDAVRCVIVDVSLGGLQVRSKQTLPVGEACFLRIARLGKKPLVIRGEVRHSGFIPDTDLIGSGFRFLPENNEDRIAIMDYVHSVFIRRSELAAS